MKAKKSLEITCLVAVGLVFAYGLGYERGRSAAMAKLDQTRSPKAIGLAFRFGRNDMPRSFTTSGPVGKPIADIPRR